MLTDNSGDLMNPCPKICKRNGKSTLAITFFGEIEERIGGNIGTIVYKPFSILEFAVINTSSITK